jgi:hypothetical protein
MFHLAIQATTTVAIFSWLMILTYALFAEPRLQTRVLRYSHDRQRRLVRALDWLRRFRFEPAATLAVVDTEGRVMTGAAAHAALARATPLLFPLWPPLWIWSRVAANRRRSR